MGQVKYLKHVFFKDKMLSPELCDVGFHCTAWRPVVIQARNTIVDLEGWNVE